MPDLKDDPEFLEWLDLTLSPFPAPSPEVARQLLEVVGSEGFEDDASGPA